MQIVPDYIDEAKVLKWAFTETQPFGVVGPDEEDKVFGLAICKYEDSNVVYRFCCNKDWEVIQDAPYNNADDAIGQLPEQYKKAEIVWRDK